MLGDVFAPWNVHAGNGIGGKQGQEHYNGGCRTRDDEAVFHYTGKVKLLE
jgi:hypothetical protein